MAQIRNYQKGVFETKSLAEISQVTDSTDTFLQFDGILTNAFSNLVLYSDAGGASPLPLTSYASTTTDDTATELEAETSTGGSGYTVYSQFNVTDATYQNVDLYATFTNFGTYTDNDAAFNQMGAEIEISSSQTVALSDGAIHTTIIVDTSTADVTVTIDPASFTGQSCDVYCSGSNLAYLKDTDGNLYQGASSLGIPISNGLKCSIRDISGKFVATNEVAADYVSGVFHVEQSACGVLVQTWSISALSVPLSAQSRTTVSSSTSWPVPFVSIRKQYGHGGGTTSRYSIPNILYSGLDELTDTGGVYVVNVTDASTTGDVFYKLTKEGKY